MRFMAKSSANLSLEEKVQVLMDERDIRQVIYRNCRAMNRGDLDLLKTCFFEDAVDHHAPFFEGEFSAFAGDSKQMSPDSLERQQHAVWQVLIDLDGDVARTESYYFSAEVFKGSTQGVDSDTRLGGGRWLDRFERREGVWRIAERWFIGEWGLFKQVKEEEELDAGGAAMKGALKPHLPMRDKSDLSYQF